MSPAAKPKAKSINDLRKWLQPTEYFSPGNEYMKHLSSYVPGTGDWLREAEAFRNWEDGMQRGCLWVRGIPGSGKSVFAASTVKTLAETQDSEGRKSPVLFFFFRQIVEKNHDPKYLVRDWVAQLLPFSTELQLQIDELSENVKSVEGNESTKLWDALVRAMEGMKKVYCVADALDEMDDQHASFIDKLTQLGAQKPESIKVMLTSRPIPRIETWLKHPKIDSVKLEPTQIYPDIDSYVSTRLENLRPRLGQAKEDLVKEAICERSEGLFLYARLTMDSLAEGLQEGSIIEDNLPTSLAQLPRNLTDLYNTMLREHSQRSGVTMEQQFMILQFITQSSRPMRLIELGSIIALLTKHTGAGLKEGKNLVRQACGRLLEILEDESVSVIHHSFTEFARDQSRCTEADAFPVLDERQAQTMMLQVCLQYLDSCQLPESVQSSVLFLKDHEEKKLDEEVEDESYDEFDDRDGRARADKKKRHEIQDLCSIYPFMAYATENLVYHIKNAEMRKALEQLDSYFFPGKNAFEIWLLVKWPGYRRANLQPLHVAAHIGATEWAQQLVMRCSEIDLRDGEGRTALMYAVEKGNLDIASLLLSIGANPDADDRVGYKPLHLAVLGNQSEITRLLLATGMSPKTGKTKCTPEWEIEQFGSDMGDTPLQYACEAGHTEILHQFINCLDVDDACRCLLLTVRSRKLDAVKAILQTGKAPVNILVGGLSALVIAADLMDPALIEILLQNGADPNLRVEKESSWDTSYPFDKITLKGGSEYGPTAMHALAGFKGHTRLWEDKRRGTQCIKLLVDAGGDVNARTVNNFTPLHYAVKKRYGVFGGWSSDKTEEIMTELLLQHGADPNVRCKSGATPLHKVSPERPRVVEILVQHGADVNARDNRQCTPLLSVLAQISCDWDMSDGSNNKKLRDETIFKLLQLGADATIETEAGSTALHQMFIGIDKFQNISLWKSFIEAGADLNKPNKHGKPPLLSMKMGNGKSKNDDLLKMLIQEGLQLNSPGLADNIVLFGLFDTMSVNAESFRKYLDLGYSAKARDQSGATLLHCCIKKRGSLREKSADIFDLLLKAGADPAAVDNDGNTLLHELALGNRTVDLASQMKHLVRLIDLGVCSDNRNKDGRTPLHIACATRTGWADRREDFLDLLLNGKLCSAFNVDELDSLGASPLHYAASFSELHVAKLLRAGADPTLKTSEGLTPLHIAARGRQSNVICLLLSEYRKRNILSLLIDASDDSGRTALHYACRSGRPESVSHLLSFGASFSLPDKVGRTPLHALTEYREESLLWTSQSPGTLPQGFYAACVTLGDVGRPGNKLGLEDKHSGTVRTKDIIEMLEIAGADFYLVDVGECTPMDLAVQRQCTEIVNELRSRGISTKERAAEALIPKSRGADEAKALLERVEPPEQGPAAYDVQPRNKDHLGKFEEILQQGDYNLFSEFVKMGGDLRARGGWTYYTGLEKYTALHKLVEWGHASLLEKYSKEAVGLDDEDWMQEEENPGSLLCHACDQSLSRLEVMKVLVEKVKVDVNHISNRYGQVGRGSKATALHLLSTGTHFWNIEATEYLLDHGADIEARNADGETALMTAVSPEFPTGFWREEIIRILLQRGANSNVLSNDGKSCLSMADHPNITRILLDHGADIKIGRPLPLTSALISMNVNAAKFLLEAGADPNECHSLHEAARPLDRDDAAADPLHGQRQREMISLLLQHKADPFLFLEDGSSIFQKVIEEHGILDLFWKQSNDHIELRGKGGRTPLISACFPTITPAPRRRWGSTEPEPKPTCNPTAASTLMELQADARATDDAGRNAVHWMCTLPEELDGTHKAVFKTLVSLSPSIIHQKDAEGFTPLQVAIANSHTHQWITEFLISSGGDAKEPDPAGNTALHYLAPQLLGEKHKALAAARRFKRFISLGLSIDHRNNMGETPLFHFISTSWEGTRHADYGHPTYALANDISHLKALDIFLQAGADLQTCNDEGETLLHMTAGRWRKTKELWGLDGDQRADMLEIFKDLMERGLDPRVENAKCRTAIDVAVSCGNTFLVDIFGPKEKGMVKTVAIEDTDDEEEDEDDDVMNV